MQFSGNHTQLSITGSQTPQVVIDSPGSATGYHNGDMTTSSVQVVSPSTCNSSPNSLQNCTTRNTYVPDPLAGVPPPSTSGLPTNPAPVGNTYQPGIYTSVFNPGNGTFTLNPGIYVLQGGLCINGQTSISSTDGVLLYITGTCNGFSFDIEGQANITLVPYAYAVPTTTTTLHVSIWQPASNTGAIQMAGKSSASSLNGIIYAPKATSVTMGTGNGALTIGSIIAPFVSIGGNGAVTISGSN
jgi:hypothetical protein